MLKDAADYNILVNFHGCTLPRGWTRTWPNLMTMEAVLGEEQYGWSERFADEAAVHNTILTCTRNVVGPMDYTPVAFGHRQLPHQVTFSHELALSVLFESGIVHMADSDQSFRKLPDKVKVFLRDVPASWDQTKYVTGYPGKDMVLARKKGDVWYLGGINGQDTEKTLDLDLSFLGEGEYQVNIIKDGADPASFDFSEATLDASNPLELSMLPKGGFVVTLTRI